MIGSICDSKQPTSLDLPLPEEILDIVLAYLGEGDLDNLVKVGNERVQYCANRRLEKLLLIKSKSIYKTIIMISIRVKIV